MEEFLKVIETLQESHLKQAEILEQLENVIKEKNENGVIKKSANFQITLLSQMGTTELNKQNTLYRAMGIAAKKLKYK